MLIVSMFEYAWRPFFLSNAKEENAKEIFARVLTYFTLFSSLIFLAVSFFIEEIVKIPLPGRGYLIGKAYWGGLNIVPIILLSYLFNGLYLNFIVGVYIEKKTKYLPYITGIGAISNIVANLVLIPLFQMTGAAIATLFSYVIMAFGMYYLNQKVYPIKYEYNRLLKIFVVTGIIFFAFLLIDNKFNLYLEIIIKLFLLILFLIVLYLLGFFYNSELKQVRKLFDKFIP